MKTLRRKHRPLLLTGAAMLMGSLLPACQPVAAQTSPTSPADLPLSHALVIPGARYGRTPVHADALEASIVSGRWTEPHAGDIVTMTDGKPQSWKAATADANGWIVDDGLNGGYAWIPVDLAQSGVYLLDASADSMVYVNGEPRVGDPYGYGTVRLPVMLQAGHNDLLFVCGQGRLHAKLIAPRAEVTLDAGDTTLPDLISGERARTQGALVVINATAHTRSGLFFAAAMNGQRAVLTPIPALPALSCRKVMFRLQGSPPASGNSASVRLQLLGREHGDPHELDRSDLKLRVRHDGETYKRTFVSAIDGSVQYYAVNPARPLTKNGPRPALVLTLHGASVEAIGQADAYEGKSWATLVAPTNRRPYGFDWEDWGRLDALEVLGMAQRELNVDSYRVYLAGHSMGGHGTWQLGALFPDRFAAIGPSAGWISFNSYVGGKRAENPSPVEAMLERAALPSDTLAFGHNYAQEGVYILHGGADDNVPVTEARTMSHYLSDFHHDYVYYEQPGAGHWWDVSPEPGADCVDWAPMYDFFARHTLPANESVRQVDFATPDPGVTDRCRWLGIEAQTHPLQISKVSVRCDPGLRRFVGTTENVSLLQLDVSGLTPGGSLTAELDGQKIGDIPWPMGTSQLWLARSGERWAAAQAPAPALKNPGRTGPFKAAFRNRMLFVYGTHGTPEENAWAYAKARYDAETFWYRGNGSIDLKADTDFEASKERDRNVIVYGNADTNSAWSALLADSPVQVRRGMVAVGARRVQGDAMACLFLRPRPGSVRALVGVVGGTGPAGMRLTDRLPYFVSGVAYPDFTLIGTQALTKGVDGVMAAGFFGPDWGMETGEFVWR